MLFHLHFRGVHALDDLVFRNWQTRIHCFEDKLIYIYIYIYIYVYIHKYIIYIYIYIYIYKRRTYSIVNHFIDMHGVDHSSLKFILIDKNHEDLLKCENFWIGILLTNHKGLNDNHDFVQQ